jgi:hypothetical protein
MVAGRGGGGGALMIDNGFRGNDADIIISNVM